MVPTWTYAKASDGVYVNMYIGSTVMLDNAAGTDVEIVQKTDYPWNGKVAVTVNPRDPARFSVRLRIPNRSTKLYTSVPEVKGIVSLAVNGKPVRPVIDKGYAVVTREWKAGDRIDLELPLQTQRITATDQIASTRGKVALRYGPMIYNVEAVDQDISKALAASAPLKAEWREDLLGGVMALTGKYADGSKLLAIPNYARANRNPGLPVEAGPLAAAPSLYMGPNAKNPRDLPKEGAPGPEPPSVSIVWIPRASNG